MPVHNGSRVDASWLKRLRRNVRNWSRNHSRDLPWRRTSDPYRIWVSEVMLQQTTVAAVVPYFKRFIRRFPTIESLARAREDDVLRLWEGLGYYSRARNLHRAARLIVREHGGRFPNSVDELRKLPGVGRYTAGAISSLAFGRPAGILEANTLRLYSRLLGYTGDPRSASGQRLLWEFAEQVVPLRNPGRFNLALMDLGATVCTPEEPACGRCPVRNSCQALAAGTQHQIPRAANRPPLTEVTEAAVAVRRRGRYLLHRRSPGERWAGLWDFPRFVLQDAASDSGAADGIVPSNGRRLEALVAGAFGLDVEVTGLLTEMRHGVTRFRIRLLCYAAGCRDGSTTARQDHTRWVRPGEFDGYPLSATGRRLAQVLQEE